MEMKHNEKTIEIYNKEKQQWKYDGVDYEKIKDLNPKLFKEISAKVKDYVENFEEREKERKEKEKQELIKKQTEQVKQWKEHIEEKFGELLKDYFLEYANPKSDSYGFSPYYLKIKPAKDVYSGYTITKDNYVYTGKWGIKTRSSSPWVVEDRHYKKRRYATLEKAIKKILKRFEDDLEAAQLKNKQNLEKLKEKNAYRDFAEELGFEYKEEYHSPRHYNRHSKGWYSHHMTNAKVTATLQYNRETKMVSISSYTVRHKNITVEEIKRVIK